MDNELYAYDRKEINKLIDGGLPPYEAQREMSDNFKQTMVKHYGAYVDSGGW